MTKRIPAEDKTRKSLGIKTGSGRSGMKRHRPIADGRSAHSKPALRRLARRAGVKRISGESYEEASGALRTWLSKIIADATVYAEHARRITVILNDVLMALKRNGQYVTNIWSSCFGVISSRGLHFVSL